MQRTALRLADRGREKRTPKHPQILGPDRLYALTARASGPQNPLSAGIEAAGAATNGFALTQADATGNSGLRESKATHE
jgi:hypothetical protein